MLEKRKNYIWYCVIVLTFGFLVFVISLVSAMSGGRVGGRTAPERQLYFGNQILPDHVFYPVLVAVDRLELEFSEPREQLEMRMKLADKRLEAAKGLFAKGKQELAFVTLGKGHQYLLRANDDALQYDKTDSLVVMVDRMNRRFASEYEYLKASMNDGQQAMTEKMIEELHVAGMKLQ
ncbi:hypothetical protein IJJ27_02190 [bacterium]|nr:hypothetical protein [bacterium]MBQ6436354.1 hypothetical protein [bacterium]